MVKALGTVRSSSVRSTPGELLPPPVARPTGSGISGDLHLRECGTICGGCGHICDGGGSYTCGLAIYGCGFDLVLIT